MKSKHNHLQKQWVIISRISTACKSEKFFIRYRPHWGHLDGAFEILVPIRGRFTGKKPMNKYFIKRTLVAQEGAEGAPPTRIFVKMGYTGV